jgi:2,4-dienoyl-CoA reductase-like NADH-dependent reductase (Old Yellow Enzyme family)/thioredoxin reductase
MSFKNLFSDFKVGSLTLKNRIIFPPISTNFADSSGNVTPEMIYHYTRRAKGGASIITLENMCISYPDGRSGATQPRIDEDFFIPGLSRIAYSVHSYNSYIFMELAHPGIMAELNVNGGTLPLAPSKVPIRKDKHDVKELTEEDIANIVQRFAKAALRAKIANFDGVEIEAAHGLLINQFLSLYSNKRIDRFGITLENRARIAKMIIDEIRKQCGQNFLVSIRIPVVDFVEGGITLEEGVKIAKLFDEMGYNLLHADVGFGIPEKRLEPIEYQEGWRVYLAESLKSSNIKKPVIAVGVIRNPSFAEDVLSSNKADLVALGRTLIADPDWPIKAENGRVQEIKRCIGCSECIKARHDEGTAIRCGVNPLVGKLESDELIVSINIPKKILIIGAGVGGLESAIIAKKRGHIVEIWEKDNDLGGTLRVASVPPEKGKLNWLIEYYRYMVKKMDIPIKYNVEVTLDNLSIIDDFKPDSIIVASSGKANIPPIKGINNKNVVLAKQILDGHINIANKNVVVGGGGMVGCETAIYLSEKGNHVTIIEMLPALAMEVENISRNYLLRKLDEHKIDYFINSPVNEITDHSVFIKNKEIQMDYFVNAFGILPDYTLYNQLRTKYESYIIGDASKPGKIIDAVRGGFNTGKTI